MTKARDLGDFISDGTIAETVTADGLDLGDNERIRLGDSQDLQILHNGLHSYIADSGTGNLYIQTTAGLIVQNSAGTETLATFTENGSVDLYYDNSVKLATSSTGATVTGTVAVTGSFNATSGTFTVQDNGTDILNVTSTVMSPQTDGAISLGSSSNGFNELYLDGTAKVGGSILQGTDTTVVYYNSVNTYTASTVIKTSATNELTDLVLTNGNNNFGSALDFARTNSASNDVRYAALAGVADSNTAGSEAGYLKFSTKGSSDSNIQERMRIDSSGSVGIGCTPDSTVSLDVQNLSASSNNVFLRIKNTTSLEDSGIIIEGNNGGQREYKIGVNVIANSSDLTFSGPTGFRYYVGSTEHMRINSSGNVGIGTTTPATKVDIDNGTSDSLLTLTTNSFGGAARTGINFQVNSFANTPSGQIAVIGDNNYSGNIVFSVANSGTTNPLTERFRIGTAGQLGIGGANYGTSGQVLTSGGSSAAPSWADASSGGMTQITSGTIGTNASYSFSLGTWWNTYKYVKIIYLATFQSGDPPSGSSSCYFRLGSQTSAYSYSGRRGNSVLTGYANQGVLALSSPGDNVDVFIEAEMFTDGTSTSVIASSGGGAQNGCGQVSNYVPTTASTFIIYQPSFGSERYRFEGPITFYGVK